MIPDDEYTRETEEVLKIFNNRTSIYAQERYNEARSKSVKGTSRTSSKARYQPRKQNKPKEYLKNAIIALTAVATIAGVSTLGINGMKDLQASSQVNLELATPVRNNTTYYNGLDEYGHPLWDLDAQGAAEETLNSNKEYDIDTRIYGTYTNLKEFERNEFMDEIMRELQRIVQENPLDYSEDEVRACNHATFDDYLASLNMDKEEYLDKMREIKVAYGRNDLEAVSELLNELKGGAR